MLASEIKTYLITKKSASIAELARHFAVDPDNMRNLLEIWVRQGKLRHSPSVKACCSDGYGCGNCMLTSLEFYDWVI